MLVSVAAALALGVGLGFLVASNREPGAGGLRRTAASDEIVRALGDMRRTLERIEIRLSGLERARAGNTVPRSEEAPPESAVQAQALRRKAEERPSPEDTAAEFDSGRERLVEAITQLRDKMIEMLRDAGDPYPEGQEEMRTLSDQISKVQNFKSAEELDSWLEDKPRYRAWAGK